MAPTTTAVMSTTGRSATERDRSMVDLRDPDEADIAYRVALAWRELRRGAATSALRDHFYGADSLEQGQIDTLDVLMTRPSWRMSELAEALHVDPSTATRAVQRLVNDGLAERRPCGNDGRVVLVAASAAGRKQHRAISKRRILALSRLLGAFDAAERRQLAHLLDRFVAELDALAAEIGALDHHDDTRRNGGRDRVDERP